jgi:hypothetical protein
MLIYVPGLAGEGYSLGEIPFLPFGRFPESLDEPFGWERVQVGKPAGDETVLRWDGKCIAPQNGDWL